MYCSAICVFSCRPTLHSSLHPAPLVPVLLSLSLHSHPTPTLTACKTLELVSQTHAEAVRGGVVRLVQEDVLRWREGGRGLRLLLRLAVMSRPFLEAVSSACLEIGAHIQLLPHRFTALLSSIAVTPDKIQALVASRADAVPSTSTSYDSHVTDQDEGGVCLPHGPGADLSYPLQGK